MHSAVMMEGWRACFVVLVLDLALARDVPSHSNQSYVIRHTDSCPDVGYYFKREPSPNAVDPGPCFLCFCQDNGTATCWERENRRCDVEKYHHHRVGRQSRIRRSPIGLSDIFLRDASRDFFDRQMPEECKPFEASFSDGCPPTDWCIGCTVCDCDANGRWDCHILSFCNGKEKKKKVKTHRRGPMFRQNQGKPKSPVNPIAPTKPIVMKVVKQKPKDSSQKNTKNNAVPNKPKQNASQGNMKQQKHNKTQSIKYVNPNKNHQNRVQRKGNNNSTKTAIKPMNNNPTKLTKHQNTQQRTNRNTQKPNQNMYRNQLVPKFQPKSNINYVKRNQIKIKANKNQSQVKHNQTKLNTNQRTATASYPKIKLKNKAAQKLNTKQPLSKPIRKKIQTVKLPIKNLPHLKKKINGTKVKIIKKNISNHKQMSLGNMKKNFNKPYNDTVKIGQKVVKQVMESVQKIIKDKLNRINATRSQRSAHLGCGDKKKDDKKTTKVRRKYIKQKNNTLVDDFNYGRYKRETLNATEAEIENSTVGNSHYGFDVSQGNISAILDKTGEPKYSIDSLSTPTLNRRQDNHNDYYKYFLHNDAGNATTVPATNFVKNLITRNKSDTPINFVIPVEPVRNVSSYILDNETIAAVNPEFNDLKFRKWYIIKIRKESRNKPVKRIVLQKQKPRNMHQNAQTFPEHQNLTKDVITTTEKRALQLPKIFSRDNITDETSEYVHNTLMKLLKEINKNHTTEGKFNSNLSAMACVRKFFHRMFTKKKSSNHKVYGLGVKEDHTLQILCENLGPCKINRNNKLFLKHKLRQLNKETGNILRSIRIIKGLLHLLDLPNIHKTNISRFGNLRSDIQKLSIVLRNTYKNEEMKPILSKTQLTQINYIKKNTQTFIECIKRFAEILNETLSLMKPNAESVNHTQKLKKSTVPYQKIKNIIAKYNILQNTFLRRIYDLIHGNETTTTTTTTEVTPAINNAPDVNSTDKIIDKYSRNIIDNLRKLKNLVQALSTNRKKRSMLSNYARDDTTDYILTLMQYLIAQNHPVASNQVYDGIDFLIDAIKNSPDIKPITRYFSNTTNQEIATSSDDADMSEHLSEDISDSKKISKEENQKNEDIGDDTTASSPQKENIDNDAISNSNYRAVNDRTTEKNSIDTHNLTTSDIGITKKFMSKDEQEKTGFEKFEKDVYENKKYDMYTGDVDEDVDGIDNTIPMITNNTDSIKHNTEQKMSLNNSKQNDHISEETIPESNVHEEDIQKNNFIEKIKQEVKSKLSKSKAYMLDVNVPDVNMPDVNVPDANVLDANMPEANVPEVHVQDTNINEAYTPEVVISKPQNPRKYVPEGNILEAHLPEVDFPDTNVPKIKVHKAHKSKSKGRKIKNRTNSSNILDINYPEEGITTKSKESSSESQDSGGETSKTKLDWLEETFDKEIREFVQFNTSEPSQPQTSTKRSKPKKNTSQTKENVSSISKENKEETKKHYEERTTPGDNVLYKKQMEFLNSLDYGTERAEFEELDSKDYVNLKADESFPSYFV